MKGASKQLLMGLNICRGSLACEQRPQSWAGTNPWGTPSTSLTPPKAPFPRAGGGCGSRTVTHVCKSHKNSAQVTVSLCPCQARLLSLAVMSLQAEGDTQTQHWDPPKDRAAPLPCHSSGLQMNESEPEKLLIAVCSARLILTQGSPGSAAWPMENTLGDKGAASLWEMTDPGLFSWLEKGR